ncbi:MAG: phospho-N-acetylmuramoyl-pentapeptide-transferase, partial [Armatimonadetes bacterium]|nr:phospho-N-acetylmuramoyl-pentapeptide-transferase [Armatimonadota bacterium]
KYPAKVFMGDTGSLALGAALGAGAILTKSVLLLPFIGFIFFVEMFSVIGQVIYFKYTKKKFGEGRRIFRRAPLHHHYELGGWSERRVVGTFWAVNLLTSILGLALWKMGILPRFP